MAQRPAGEYPRSTAALCEIRTRGASGADGLQFVTGTARRSSPGLAPQLFAQCRKDRISDGSARDTEEFQTGLSYIIAVDPE